MNLRVMSFFFRFPAPRNDTMSQLTPRIGSTLLVPFTLLALALVFPQPLPAQQVAGATLNLPRFSSGGVTEEYFSLDLASGRISLADQLRREPDRVRLRRGELNLFQAIGRPTSQPAQPGELALLPIRESDRSVRTALFVETSTGYTAFFDEVGRSDQIGKIVTTIGRPFGPLAAADLNFVLLPRREGSGKTVGAYLYHGTTGKGLYISGLDEIKPDPPVSATAELPTSTGYITAAPITSQERTESYVVIDSGTGGVFFLNTTGRPEQLAERKTSLELFGDFAAEQLNVAPRRFYPVPLQDGQDTTRRVLIVDVGSGQLGLLDGIRSPEPRVAILPQNIYSSIAGGIQTTSRHVELIPAVESGGTRGVWLSDSLTNTLLYIESPDSPADIAIRRVTVGR